MQQRRKQRIQDVNEVSSPGSITSEERIDWERVEKFLTQLRNGLVIMDEESCERYFYGSHDYYNWLTAIYMFEGNLEFVVSTEGKERDGTRRRNENRRKKNERRKREKHKSNEACKDPNSGENHSIFNPKGNTKNDTVEINHCTDNRHCEIQSMESNDVSHKVAGHGDDDGKVDGECDDEGGLKAIVRGKDNHIVKIHDKDNSNHASVEIKRSNKVNHPKVVLHHGVYDKDYKMSKIDEDNDQEVDLYVPCNKGVHEVEVRGYKVTEINTKDDGQIEVKDNDRNRLNKKDEQRTLVCPREGSNDDEADRSTSSTVTFKWHT